MKPLEIHCRGRVMYAKISIDNKGMGMIDYTLHNKNGFSIYIFRKEQGEWRCAYGDLDSDIKEACIDTLILRFDRSCVDMFYHNGVRQVIRISPHEKGLWHIFRNNSYAASIQFDPFSKKYEYHFDDNSLIDNKMMEKYIDLINRGDVKWMR